MMRSKTTRTYAWTTFLNLAGRGFNFLLFIFIVSIYGANENTDWFFFVCGISLFLNSVIFSSLESAIVPAWPRLSDSARKDFLNQNFRTGAIVMILLQVVGILATRYIPPLFHFNAPVSRFTTVAVSFLMFLQPAIVYYSSVYASILQASGNYTMGIMHVSIRTLGVFPLLVLPFTKSIEYLALAYTVGELLRCLVLRKAVINTVKNTFTFGKPDFSRFRPEFNSIALMALTIAAINLAPFVDYLMAGRFGDGSATLIEYTATLKTLPQMVLNGVLVYLFGQWSMKNDTIQWSEIRKQVLQIIGFGILMVIPFILTLDFWVPLIFREPKFSAAKIDQVKLLLIWFMISSVFFLAIYSLHRVYFAMKKYRFIFVAGVMTAVLNVFFNLVFIRYWQLTGIAMGTAFVEAIVAAFLFFNAKKLTSAA